MAFDPEKASNLATGAGSALGIVAIIGGFLAKYIFMTKSYGHKVFSTKQATEATYLRKHTDTVEGVEYKGADTLYAPIQDMATIKQLHEEALDESRKWRELAKDWMQRP